MSVHDDPAPIERRFFSPGMKIIVALMLLGAAVGVYRLLFSLASVTSLSDEYPFGLWKGLNVAAGVALAAAGFTSAAFVYVLHREHFHAIIRPALLIAMLGYTFAGVGLLFDLGLWYAMWHPALPSMWQGNSVLFEVAMCVMLYLIVLYTEFVPVALERFMGRVKLPGRLARYNELAETLLRLVHFVLGKVMFLFVIFGITLSCLHQSSLGALLVIAPYKLHPLYWSTLSPLFFLTSAIAVGFPMITFVSMIATRTFGGRPNMALWTPLAGTMPYLMGVYIVLKIGDMLYRGSYAYLLDGSPACIMFWIEFGLLTVVPFCLLLSSDVRRSPLVLFIAAGMYVFAVLLNRCTVFFIAYEPPHAEGAYVPALGELALAIGLIATIVFVYRAVVTIFPVLPRTHQASG